jgi:phosphopantothenoylcysteine decarboxylase/phosphopantothenate--cysteine ligase
MPQHTRQQPRVLITAGPTHEPIDQVRFIGNQSSGRLGIALANQSVRRGWPTTLLIGPATADYGSFPQESIQRFRTADELGRLLAALWPSHDVLIMAAAVADFRPAKPQAAGKLRRSRAALSLELEPTPDLLANLASTTRADQLVIGFALEPAEELEASARRKLREKRVDAIVANPIETLDAETIDATLFLHDGTQRRPGDGSVSKSAFAVWLLDEVAKMRDAASEPRPQGSGERRQARDT